MCSMLEAPSSKPSKLDEYVVRNLAKMLEGSSDMRTEDINRLKEPYNKKRDDIDRRFHSAIGADVRHAGQLVKDIFGDLDTHTLGISWWASVPTLERPLISDYLYQCAYGIEVNLAEAKLHYMEWLDARDRHNERIANVVYRESSGKLDIKMPSSQSAFDDPAEQAGSNAPLRFLPINWFNTGLFGHRCYRSSRITDGTSAKQHRESRRGVN